METKKLFPHKTYYQERQYPKEDLLPLIAKQLDEGLSFFGKTSSIEEFEENFKKKFDLAYCFSLSSGTAAIATALFSVGAVQYDEIICASYGYWAVLAPALQFGCVPIFVDTDSKGNISLSSISDAITSKTKAVIITHSLGFPNTEIEYIAEMLALKGIYLIEDCSQAFGAKVKEKMVGSFGDICLWSLQERKLINGGEGGIIGFTNVYNFELGLLYAHNRVRTVHEIKNPDFGDYKYSGTGNHFRMSPISAVIANWQLNNMEQYIKVKNYFASEFNHYFDNSNLFRPVFRKDKELICSYHLYPLEIIGESISPKQVFEFCAEHNFFSVSYGKVMSNISTLKAYRKPLSSFRRKSQVAVLQSDKNFQGCKKIIESYIFLPVPKVYDALSKKYLSDIKSIFNLLK